MRYAIYFSPPQDDALTLEASAWLGRDAFSDHMLTPASLDGMTLAAWQSLTKDPARYGFHATLKAPFSLSEGCTEDQLLKAFDDFCRQTPACSIDRLALSQLGPFFALVPDGPSPAVDTLCGSVVEVFEPFRAPLGPDDMARRKPERLSENQRAHLQRWGYPYVFDEFRFHMTLSGPVSAEEQPQVRAMLEHRFARFIGQPLQIGHLALFAEPTRGAPFIITRHSPLSGRTGDSELVQ